jgi:isopentenyl phosphate kinase
MSQLLFLKLGGSLITDKTGVEAVRAEVLARLAAEIAQARATRPDLKVVLGHGSGSFGHVAGARHATRQGVQTAEQWRGFAEVAASAARLNSLVRHALLDAGLAAVSLSPVASARCEDGRILSLSLDPITDALDAGLLPIIYGDVAFDTVRGGTIIATEEIMSYMAESLRPSWLLLAGETAGVLDSDGRVIPLISESNLSQIRPALGGSRGTDVTGGMLAKVLSMLALVDSHPQMTIRIFSGLEADQVQAVLLQPDSGPGTVLTASQDSLTIDH